MTTHITIEKRCGHCGAVGQFTGVTSTSAFGSSDLDTRPPPMQRSTLSTWVQRCAECGCCAPDVSTVLGPAASVVREAPYQAQRRDTDFPELANSFLCWSILAKALDDLAGAGWALIHAAWACDDSGHEASAAVCRRKAAAALTAAAAEGQPIADEKRAETAILVDLLRRAGDPEAARSVLSSIGGEPSTDVIGHVLAFQAVLLDRGDQGCHTVAEAMGDR